MKRSNRLIMLVGIFLAVVAFVGIIAIASRGGAPAGGPAAGPTVPVVAAKQDLSAGTALTVEQLEVRQVDEATAPRDAFRDPAELNGQVLRKPVTTGQTLTAKAFQTEGATTGNDIVRGLKPGLRAMAVQVDQTTGVGTLIQPGDRVDVVLALQDTDAKNPVWGARGPNRLADDTLNNTTVKVLVQNVEVLGTLLPPPPVEQGQQGANEGEENEEGARSPALTGQQQLAVLGLTPQQVELVRFTQLDGNLSLVLRAPADAAKTVPDRTTGMTLRQLVDEHGVLPPRIVETEFP